MLTEAASLLTDVAHSVAHGRLVRAENRVRSQGLVVALLLDLTYCDGRQIRCCAAATKPASPKVALTEIRLVADDHPELTSCAVELLVRQFEQRKVLEQTGRSVQLLFKEHDFQMYRT